MGVSRVAPANKIKIHGIIYLYTLIEVSKATYAPWLLI